MKKQQSTLNLRGKKSAWLQRQHRDVFVKRSKQDGWRSRSAYKLLAINEQDKLLTAGMTVLDLGAAPGGWSQVAQAAVGSSGLVIAIDKLNLAPIAGVQIIEQDIQHPDILSVLETELMRSTFNVTKRLPLQFDVILSDMAPNITGWAATDQANMRALLEMILTLMPQLLRPDGSLLVKVFHGTSEQYLRERLQSLFKIVKVRKPKASRSESSEVYLLARGYNLY